MYSHEAGVIALKGFDNQHSTLTAHHPSIGKIFRDNNYRTAYFGKGHFEIPVQDLGFEEGLCTDHIDISDQEAEQGGFAFAAPALRRDYHAHQQCCQWLDDFEDDERPLFLFFSTNLPHPPFFAVPEYIKQFPEDQLQLPPSHGKEDWKNKPDFFKAHAEGSHGSHDSAQQRTELAEYYSMIASMDSHFGDIMTHFKRLDLWNDTIVLLVADHGDMMGGHNVRLKGTLPYDDILQIPMIWRFPNNAYGGTHCDALLDQVHVPTTLLEAAGLEIPDSFGHGSQLSAICGKEHGEQHIFFEHYAAYWGTHPFMGLRSHEWKYVRYYGAEDDGFEELYHLQDDPLELHNIAQTPEHHERLADFRQQCGNWWGNTQGKDFDFYQSEYYKTNQWNQERFATHAAKKQ